MKRITLTILLLAPIALSGCQLNPFRHKTPAYKSAHQERPLEVPPGMNQPSTTDALAIPNAGPAAASSAGATAPSTEPEAAAPPAAPAPGSPASATGSSMTLSDTPDSVYHRIGLALQRSDVGEVTAHDDADHTYEVAVDTVVTHKPGGGFLHRMFHHGTKETVKGTVAVSVTPSTTNSGDSVVRAQGNPDAVAQVMEVLHQRLQ